MDIIDRFQFDENNYLYSFATTNQAQNNPCTGVVPAPPPVPSASSPAVSEGEGLDRGLVTRDLLDPLETKVQCT